MRGFTLTSITAAAIGLAITGFHAANAQYTGQYVYSTGGPVELQHHVNLHIDGSGTCGILVDNGTVLALYQSSLDQSEPFNISDHASDRSATLVCVTGQAGVGIDHTFGVLSQQRTNGVWAYGLNSTARLSNFRLTSLANDSWGIVSTDQAAVFAKDVEYDSNTESSFGFVAQGGFLSIDNSVAYADGLHSSALTVQPSNSSSGWVYAKGFTGSSLLGAAVFLYGAAKQVLFEHCHLTGGGDAVIVSTAPRGGHATPVDLIIMDSTLISTHPTSPVLHYAVSDSRTFITNSSLNAVSNDLVMATCSPVYFEGCTEFFTNITVVDTQLVGNIQAWRPARLHWDLASYTTWTGYVVNAPADSASSPPDIFLDDTSVWNVTKDSWVRALVSGRGDVSNIGTTEPNVTVYYDAAVQENAYLGSRTFEMGDNGFVKPYLGLQD